MLDFTDQIAKFEQKGLYRDLKSVMPLEDGYCMFRDKKMLNLSSNDYLGLVSDKAFKDEFLCCLNDNPQWLNFGSSSSRLLTGNTELYDETETVLKNLYGAGAALFFNSGYHANIGILPVVSTKEDLILSDKLCHSSIIDGARLSNATHIRYRHLDYEHLELILRRDRGKYKNVFIVSESIYSMDGDEADLSVLVGLKQKYDAILYVDEAHAVGAVGARGLGLSEVQNVIPDIDILIGTMGKALASVGAYAIFAKNIRTALLHKGRSFIYTTALPPINMAWSKFVLERIPLLSYKRETLSSLSTFAQQYFRLNCQSQNFIIPIVIGENEITVKLALHLQEMGILVFPIRPPTVPEGTARLRLSLTANLSVTQLKLAFDTITNARIEFQNYGK